MADRGEEVGAPGRREGRDEVADGVPEILDWAMLVEARLQRPTRPWDASLELA